MVPGRTFHFPRSVNTHRYVVISDPCSHPADDVVFVNFTTFRAGADATCVVTPAEYSALGHNSCIAYGEARAVALSWEGILAVAA